MSHYVYECRIYMGLVDQLVNGLFRINVQKKYKSLKLTVPELCKILYSDYAY